ncbi:hypothetical protein EI94DRAFT_1560253 [Lactarius quietus]|nr:hypothetical protein EI94DRAFT_1560253 [Lactarius quietus]
MQVHQCSHSCMKLTRGHYTCKRKAPFPLASDDFIDENGNWGPKRSFPYLNNWNPDILLCIHANHDIKLITNGMETRDIAWYISCYVAKKHLASFNASTLLAVAFAYHRAYPPSLADTTAINKRLIQRCANSLSREQELSALEVISYLMDWGDRYMSHHFQTIHL